MKLTESGGVVTDEKKGTGHFTESQEGRISKAIETADGAEMTIGSKGVVLTGTCPFFVNPVAPYSVK